MICPICGIENTDDWLITVGYKILEGGCQDCLEKEMDKSWWKQIENVYAFEETREVSK